MVATTPRMPPNRKDREKIHGLVTKRLARQDAEADIRGRWDRFTYEEKMARVDKLEELCNELIQHHPDYVTFKTAKVYIISGTCKIHWNGARANESTGWGIIDREFPEEDIPIVIKRMSDKLRLQQKEEEL